MKTLEFTIDKSNNIFKIKREFAAPKDRVWAAWTEPELLDQWWAPKPWEAKTKSMEFKVGGRRLYAMCGPTGEEHWALARFTSIAPETNFQYWDAFCDKHGNTNDGKPRSDWSIDFMAPGDSTMVNITIKHESLAHLEKVLELGFKEGFTIALSGLDHLLLNIKKIVS